jgi:hypothetical protein
VPSLTLSGGLHRLWRKEGEPGLCLGSFYSRCVIGPCRQRLISHREFPSKVAWVLGETRGEIASRCHLVSLHGCKGGNVGTGRKGLGRQTRV